MISRHWTRRASGRTTDDSAEGSGLVIQADGRIVAAGSTTTGSDQRPTSSFALVRYLGGSTG